MKKNLILALLLLFASFGFAQGTASRLRYGATLPSTCSANGDVFSKTGTGAGLYRCSATNTWSLVSASLPPSANVLGTDGSGNAQSSTAHNVSAVSDCAAASASGTAYTCTTSPSFTPASGDKVYFKADVANTGSATLSVNGATAATIKKQGGSATLVANDLKASQWTTMIYDGTYWQMQGQVGNSASGGYPTLAMPSQQNVSGSGTSAITVTNANENQSTVFAGPAAVTGTNASLVQVCSNFSGASVASLTATCGQNIAAGDTLVVYATSSTTMTMSDSVSDTFTVKNGCSSGSGWPFGSYSCVTRVLSAVGGNTDVKVTPGSSASAQLVVLEYHGITADDGSIAACQGSSPLSCSITTTTANDLVVGFSAEGGFGGAGISNTSGVFTQEYNSGGWTFTSGSAQNVAQLAMDAGAAGIGTYTAQSTAAGAAGGNGDVIFLLAFKTGSTTSGAPGFRYLVPSDIPVVSNYTFKADTLNLSAAVSDVTMYTTTATGFYNFHGAVNCDSASSGATATLNLKWTDESGTAQTQSVTATCTSLGSSSVASLFYAFRAGSGSAIKYGVTIANTPTYNVSVRLKAQ